MPEKRPRITQKHIAEAAGVSKSAVSLALRNHPSLPRATRERIRRLADRMGYYPDPALSALMGYRHGHRTLKKLRELGYRRIGFALQNTVDARVEHAWLGAYLLDRELDGDGPPIPPLLFRGAQRDRFQGWFDDHRPDAVVTAEPGFAATLIDWCGRLNLKVPNDIGVAVVSNVPLEGRFSGINERSEQIGKTAVDVLARLLYRNETGISDTPRRILIDGTWVPGQTLKAAGRKRRDVSFLVFRFPFFIFEPPGNPLPISIATSTSRRWRRRSTKPSRHGRQGSGARKRKRKGEILKR